MFLLAQNGLSAGLSELAEPDLPPGVSQILAYEAVVEHLYRDLTVIPVRYRCQLPETSEALALLERHRDEYGALLDELEDKAEMGIRVLLDSSGVETDINTWPVSPESSPFPCDSGAGYLAAKRERYLGLDRAALHEHLLVEEISGSLAGLYVRRKVEFPDSNRSRLLSLYFLVPRASVETFRRAARQFHPKEPVKLLLSGPWPPYNFVESFGK